MSFNPDFNKQAQEVIFSRKLQKSNHPSLTFNGSSVIQSEIQKHAGIFLNSKLDFNERIQNVLNNVSKTIGLLGNFKKFTKILFNNTLSAKYFGQKKCLKILASKTFCSPKILTSEVALNEKNVFFFFNNYDKHSHLCGSRCHSHCHRQQKQCLHLLGYNLNLILLQRSLHFVVYSLTLTLRS